MDKLIQQLIKIEENAVNIIDQANQQKQLLSDDFDQKKADYEKMVDAQTEETLNSLSEKLEDKRKKDIKKLHIDTQKSLVALNTEYKQNGKRIAKQILQRILEA